MNTLDHLVNEDAAFSYLESWLWPDGPCCPHCGAVGKAGRLTGVKGKSGRPRFGLWKCYAKDCRKQFTVKVGTIFERAHTPLHKILYAAHLMSESKISISRLQRALGVTYKSAWFLYYDIPKPLRVTT